MVVRCSSTWRPRLFHDETDEANLHFCSEGIKGGKWGALAQKFFSGPLKRDSVMFFLEFMKRSCMHFFDFSLSSNRKRPFFKLDPSVLLMFILIFSCFPYHIKAAEEMESNHPHQRLLSSFHIQDGSEEMPRPYRASCKETALAFFLGSLGGMPLTLHSRLQQENPLKTFSAMG